MIIFLEWAYSCSKLIPGYCSIYCSSSECSFIFPSQPELRVPVMNLIIPAGWKLHQHRVWSLREKKQKGSNCWLLMKTNAYQIKDVNIGSCWQNQVLKHLCQKWKGSFTKKNKAVLFANQTCCLNILRHQQVPSVHQLWFESNIFIQYSA